MTQMMQNVLSLLFLAWLIGFTVVGWGNSSTTVMLVTAGPARDGAVPVSIGETQPQPMDTGNREAPSMRGMGALFGRVTMGPMSPVGRSADPGASAAVPGARIMISSVHGQEITSVVTEADGGYRLRIPPGIYRIDMPPLTGGRFTKDVPTTVTIAEGQQTRLDIRIDTGVR